MGREGCKQNARGAAVSQRTQPAQGKVLTRPLPAPSYSDEVAMNERPWVFFFLKRKSELYRISPDTLFPNNLGIILKTRM